MALVYTPAPEVGFLAPDFDLMDVSGRKIRLADFQDSKGLLVLFICNHCPYVIAVQERLNTLAKKIIPQGIAVVAINSNDPNYRQEDSYVEMQKRAKEIGYVFPYLVDEDQSVARNYGAVCTPDPFLFENKNGKMSLVYRGRIDDSWKDESLVKVQDLQNAVECLLQGKPPIQPQIPSMGCSIKWKT